MADTDKQEGVKAPEVEDVDPAAEMKAHSTGESDGGSASSSVPATVDQDADETQDVIDTIQPKAEPKSWTLREYNEKGEVTTERTYVQRPLNFFGKMNFFSLAGEVIDKSLSGDDGLRLSALFEMPGDGRTMSASDFRDADTFVQGVGKILTYAPDFLEKSYVIWLGVPDYEVEWAKAVMKQPADRGGLSDDDGVEIIEVFIDQNWESLETFFREKIGSLRDRIQSHRKEVESGE